MDPPTLFAISLLGDAISIAAGLTVFAVLFLVIEGFDRV